MTRLIEVIEDGVSLAALEENAHDGCVETVLFDAARAGCGGSPQQIAPRRCEVVLIQGGMRKNQIAGIDGISIIRISRLPMLAQQLLGVVGVELRFPAIGFDT